MKLKSIFRRLTSRSAAPVVTKVAGIDNENDAYFLTGPHAGLATSTAQDWEDLYANHVWVYAATYAIAMTAAMLPLRIGRRDRDGAFVDFPDDHPAARLLRKPNASITQVEFVELSMVHAELTGASYWLAARNGRKSAQGLIAIAPHMMRVTLSADGNLAFAMRDSQRSAVWRDIDPRDVLYFRYVSPAQPGLHMSPSAPAQLSIETDLYAQRYNRAFFKNYAAPGGVLTTDVDIPPSQEAAWRKATQEAWYRAFHGVQHAFRVAVLTKGLRFQPVQIPISEMQFVELRKMTRDEILAVRGVPPILVGILEGNTFANAEMQLRQLLPKLVKHGEVLTRFLQQEFGEEIEAFYDVSQIAELSEPQDALAKRGQILITSGQWTPNEVRERLWQLPPVEGGDVLYPPRVFPPEVVLPTATPESGNMSLLPDKRKIREGYAEKVRRRREHATREDIVGMTDAVRTYLYEQRDRIVKRIRDGYATPEGIMNRTFEESAIFDLLFEWRLKGAGRGIASGREFIDELRGGKRAKQVGLGGIVNPSVIEHIRQQTRPKSKYVTDTSFDRLKQILSKALESGEPGMWQAEEIASEVFEDWTEQALYRAERIARTEMAGAWNYGFTESMREAGYQKHEWSSSKDPDVRKTHRIDGETVEIGQAFSNDVIIPGEEGPVEELVNCRCVTIPVEEED